jgi:hypothetical protein
VAQPSAEVGLLLLLLRLLLPPSRWGGTRPKKQMVN